jgi:hypothetical protein
MSCSARYRVPSILLSGTLIGFSALWFVSACVFYLTSRSSKDGVFGAPVWALLLLILVPLSMLLLLPLLLKERRGVGERLKAADYCALVAGGVSIVFAGFLFLAYVLLR